MRQAKNNSIMYKIQLISELQKKLQSCSIRLQNNKLSLKKHKARGSWLTMTMKKWIFCTKTTYLKILKAKDQLQAYPASRGYIFAVWDGVRKVASADNRSIFYRAYAKFVRRFASNWFVKSAWVSRESKLRKLLANNSPRAFVLFFCFASLVLSILVAKFPRIVFWESIMLPTVASPVWFEGSTFNSKRQFFFPAYWYR